MVVKHPYIFREANTIVLNKIDLAKAMSSKILPQLERDAKKINPHVPFIKTNALSGMVYLKSSMLWG